MRDLRGRGERAGEGREATGGADYQASPNQGSCSFPSGPCGDLKSRGPRVTAAEEQVTGAFTHPVPSVTIEGCSGRTG